MGIPSDNEDLKLSSGSGSEDGLPLPRRTAQHDQGATGRLPGSQEGHWQHLYRKPYAREHRHVRHHHRRLRLPDESGVLQFGARKGQVCRERRLESVSLSPPRGQKTLPSYPRRILEVVWTAARISPPNPPTTSTALRSPQSQRDSWIAQLVACFASFPTLLG